MRHRAWLVLATALALPQVAAAAEDNLSMVDPASPPAGSIRELFYLVLAITGGIFVIVEGLIVYCLFRFRRRTDIPEGDPPQVYGSNPIEIAWTVGPLLIVFVLFMIVVRYVGEINAGAREPPPKDSKWVYVTVVGHQWWWEYRLFNNPEDQDKNRNGVRIANELHVPVSRPGGPPEKRRRVILRLESVDVIHSYWVPRLAGKTDVVPNKTNWMWFEPREKGLFLGQCAEFCGTQHAGMLIRVYADPEDEFQTWLANQRKNANEDLNKAERKGKEVFLSQACVNCHAVRGTLARGTFGPDLTHLKSRQTLVTGLVVNDRKNLTDWVRDPQEGPDHMRGIKPGCLMPNMHLSDEQVKQIVTYLEALK